MLDIIYYRSFLYRDLHPGFEDTKQNVTLSAAMYSMICCSYLM